MSLQTTNSEKFRDQLATVSETGKRLWIYPKKPSGKFYTARSVVSLFLLAFLFGAPFVKINGHQFILLNIFERKFILFGIPFGPHDFHLFGLAMITIFVSIFLFTVVYGRIFCGWLCPQTIFLEMVFRKIEYFIEGDANKQKVLNLAPWTSDKFFKKTAKHLIFLIISIFIAHTFIAYIIGIEEVISIISQPPSAHFTGFIATIVFTGAFYFVFSSFREQACTMVCPYGRLQGVMLDQNSIVIAYDHVRGEPRGKIKKNVEQNLGDCIDCHLCVDVCPTGIDIRNGTQLECVNCTACIDACDAVMKKVKRPTGLIRYASKNEIKNKIRSVLNPRSIGYTVVLILLLSLITTLLINRSDFELSIFRTPGLMYQHQPGDKISNLYDVKIMNKTFNSMLAKLELRNIEGEIKVVGGGLNVEPQGIAESKFLVILPNVEVTELNTKLNIAVLIDDKVIDIIQTSFLGNVRKDHK